MNSKCSSLIFVLLFAISLHSAQAQQYLKTKGTSIVDATGKEIILRGMGLGGWMLQEAYMMQMSDVAGRQGEIRARIESVIGKNGADEFYAAWWANHCTKADIDALARWGFNSIRLPMHYNLFTLPIEQEPKKGKNTWLERGFTMTDSLLKWCAANKMYLILDLHAAPGGQGKDANINDYDATKPSLWESPENKQKTIALWRKLAERYGKQDWIGGYDLINEPNWAFTEGAHPNGIDEKNNADIWQLYIEITKAIREVDKRNIIYVEGNGWANNFEGMPPAWDSNMAINFHGYWNPNATESIQKFLDLREKYNLPLWMSESGENSNQWFTERIKLLEMNNIGWAWWPMKKIGSVVGPLTVEKIPGYQSLLDYWKNGGNKPDENFSKKILMGITEKLKYENCEFHPDVIDAIFRQLINPTAIAYKETSIPGLIHFTDFDMGGHNFAYRDNDYKNTGEGNQKQWNTGWSYRNDGVDIHWVKDSDKRSNKYAVFSIEKDEWIKYTTNVKEAGTYKVEIRLKKNTEAASLRIDSNDETLVNVCATNPMSEINVWESIVVENIHLQKGVQTLKIYFEVGDFEVGFMEWIRTGE